MYMDMERVIMRNSGHDTSILYHYQRDAKPKSWKESCIVYTYRHRYIKNVNKLVTSFGYTLLTSHGSYPTCKSASTNESTPMTTLPDKALSSIDNPDAALPLLHSNH